MGIQIGAQVDQTYAALGDNTPGLGDVYFGPDGKVYKFVLYNTGSGPVAAVAGNVCYYYGPGGVSTGSTTTVTSDLSDSAGLGAGVLQSAPSATNGLYCWIQTQGPAVLTPALTAGADGNALTAVGATDGTLDVSALVTDAVVAFCVDAGTKTIMCRFPW